MNYDDFRAEVARRNVTYRHLAACLGLSEQAFYNKAAGRTEFKSSEIKTLAKELNLDMNAVNAIFFDDAVN